MKSKLISLLILAASVHALSAQAASDGSETWRSCYRGARTPVMIVNRNDIAFTPQSGKALDAEQVKKAIVQAGMEKGWTVSNLSDGKLLATLQVRGKHHVSLEIPYSSSKYSLRYKDSSNLHYAKCEGDEYIHPFYNKWVESLNKAIQSKLTQL